MLQLRVSKLTVMFCYGFVIESAAAGKGALECHPTVILEIQSRCAALSSEDFPANSWWVVGFTCSRRPRFDQPEVVVQIVL